MTPTVVALSVVLFWMSVLFPAGEGRPSLLSISGSMMEERYPPQPVAVGTENALSTSVFSASSMKLNSSFAEIFPTLPLIGMFVLGAVWWTVARVVRRGQGVDMDLVYKTIPPD